MNESNFLRKRDKVGHGRRQATRTTPRLLAALIALFLLGLAASGGTSAVAGTTFTVDSTGDTADANVGDGICADLAGNCTLRAAIAESEASAGFKDTIAFTGPLSIALESDLPTITDPVDIDGTTQPGCAGSPVVEVQGSSNPHNHQGLVLNAGASTVCGLALNRLYVAIRISSSDNRIEGNFIGTDVAGGAALANENAGISVFSGARNQLRAKRDLGQSGIWPRRQRLLERERHSGEPLRHERDRNGCSSQRGPGPSDQLRQRRDRRDGGGSTQCHRRQRLDRADLNGSPSPGQLLRHR